MLQRHKCDSNSIDVTGPPEETDYNQAEGYVFLSSGLSGRDDYSRTTRFKFYKKYNIKFVHPGDEKEFNRLLFKKRQTLLSVFVNDGQGLHPICEEKKKCTGTSDLSLESLMARWGRLEKTPVRFALLGITEPCKLFESIVRAGIPFAFISPPGNKCEWMLVDKDNKTLSAFDCVECKEKQEKGCCSSHKDTYEKESADNALADYQERLFYVFPRTTHLFKRIPVFQMSTGVDLVRWYRFHLAYRHAHRLMKDRLGAANENLVNGLVQEIEKRGADNGS